LNFYFISTDKLWSPLESFSVVNNSTFFFNNLNLDILLYFMFVVVFISLVLQSSNSFFTNKHLFFFINKVYFLLFNLFKNLILSIRLERFFNFVSSVFILIVFMNLAGFFLLELSITSHAVITLFLSFTLFFNYLITSLIINNEKFYKQFVISNLNFVLAIVLFLIELTSYFVRPFSLGIRLFANILSGHILIHIFFSAFLYAYKLFFWLSVFIFFMVLFVLTMEIFVSFVQAYIYLILSIIYMQDIFLKKH